MEEPKDVVALNRSNDDDEAIKEEDEEDVKAKILKAAQQYYEEVNLILSWNLNRYLITAFLYVGGGRG